MQANSYLGLWGKVFDTSQSGNESTLADHFQQVADEWKQGTESIHSRIIQRMQTGHSDVWNTSSGLLSDIAALVTQLTTPASIESTPHINKTLNGSTDSVDQLNLLERLQERLGQVHLGSLDSTELAVLAALQGVALSSLVKHAAALSSQSQHAWYTTQQGSSYAPQNDVLKTATHHTSHVGLKLPPSFSSHFKPELCVNLQNFGNSPGYRAVYMGSPPCTAKGNDTVFARATWGQEAGVLLDCHVGSTGDKPELNLTLNNIGNTIQQAYASELDAILHLSRTCRLAVAATVNGSPSSTGPGTSSLLKYRQSLPAIGRSKWNAIRIRVCNM